MQGKKKATFLWILTAAIFLVGGGGSYMIYGGLSDKQAKINSLKAEAKDAEALEAELADLKTQVGESSDKLAHLEKGIPELAYIPTMLKELETFGKANGIDVKGVRPIPAPKDKNAKVKKKAKPYNELAIEIKGKGKFRSVLNFIAALKTFPKIVAARTVSLTPKMSPKNENSGTDLEVVVELRAFLFKPDKDEPVTVPGLTETNGDPMKSNDASSPKTSIKGFSNEG